MDRLLFTAVSGASHSLMQQQISANNLANANTTGFRADIALSQSEAVRGLGFATRVMVQPQTSGVDASSAAAERTGRPLDVAIQGEGYIAVQNSDGSEVYTRNGNMVQNEAGQLTINGYPVLGDNGPIVLPPNAIASFGRDGTLSITPDDGDVTATMDIDRLKLVTIPPENLAKNGQGMIVTADGSRAPLDENINVSGGYLEGSNVTAVTEMLASISLSRQFEAQIKMMKAAQDLSEAGNRLLRGS
ncbi:MULTISPECIES: flagellar basal body rod protein FlgF [Enterobacteriaceae]|uniref:flagellar basal body rod protein FlgF n=1 Tax=Enterobacteriaceae TaxID=543 RepID=UPI000E9C89EC|nr:MULTISPECIES: flagellar basal body rod protein FlgF [Enterobacteriaceae]MDF2776570.1 flagellar basal body rod protein FlgF [Enterobacteriaceae bacterium]HAZ77995.1 flagellar biosynthesis protein FlgF [Enterobacteriaceae bacterium]